MGTHTHIHTFTVHIYDTHVRTCVVFIFVVHVGVRYAVMSMRTKVSTKQDVDTVCILFHPHEYSSQFVRPYTIPLHGYVHGYIDSNSSRSSNSTSCLIAPKDANSVERTFVSSSMSSSETAISMAATAA